MKKLSIILVLLVLAPVLAQALENETTASTVDAGNETAQYFENQEEMKEKAADILKIIMDIVRDILRYIQTTLSEMPLTE
ncbi:unnamed protein product [marine sediment metagenome]|uniref:Uncharacterized protein n=1 Tax=marine sediment metagenome TaxID=412755 RepID=X0VAQ2_9ZZZZ